MQRKRKSMDVCITKKDLQKKPKEKVTKIVADTHCQDLIEDTQEDFMGNRATKDNEAMTSLEVKKGYYPFGLDNIFSINVQRCFPAPSNYVYRILNLNWVKIIIVAFNQEPK